MGDHAVEIVEVSPRDGLQNESVILPAASKVELVDRCLSTGLRRIEVTSFVHPNRVPQMADAEEVAASLPLSSDDARLSALVLNRRGFERAQAAGVRELNMVVLASETFNQRNQGESIAETLAALADIAVAHRADGGRLTVTIGAAFGCPFEGEVAVDAVSRLAGDAIAAGVDELCLADTIGVATPRDVRERLAAVREVSSNLPLRCHFHNTRNTGIANAVTAVESGVTALDASLGGIGGCPFAPNATGNIATEDLAYAMTRMGLSIATDVSRLTPHVLWLEEQLGKQVPGLLSRAGDFPPR